MRQSDRELDATDIDAVVRDALLAETAGVRADDALFDAIRGRISARPATMRESRRRSVLAVAAVLVLILGVVAALSLPEQRDNTLLVADGPDESARTDSGADRGASGPDSSPAETTTTTTTSEHDETPQAPMDSSPSTTAPSSTMQPESTTTSVRPSETDHGQRLRGRTYQSTSAARDGQPYDFGAAVTVEFEERQAGDVVRWHIECNFYGAEVVISADRLVTGEIGGTDMGCPPDQLEQDQKLATFFDSDPQWTLEGPQLTLRNADTVIVLREVVAEE